MPTILPGTRETILVVDDDPLVLAIAVMALERANFRVYSADSGADAIELATAINGRIHLVLSDVLMEQVSGPDIGETLKKIRPDIHVMLMSGGINGNLLVLNYGWSYIQKPFAPAKLVKMIEDVLHSPHEREPWSERPARLDHISSGSPEYSLRVK